MLLWKEALGSKPRRGVACAGHSQEKKNLSPSCDAGTPQKSLWHSTKFTAAGRHSRTSQRVPCTSLWTATKARQGSQTLSPSPHPHFSTLLIGHLQIHGQSYLLHQFHRLNRGTHQSRAMIRPGLPYMEFRGPCIPYSVHRIATVRGPYWVPGTVRYTPNLAYIVT